jgi:hypothetical protein
MSLWPHSQHKFLSSVICGQAPQHLVIRQLQGRFLPDPADSTRCLVYRNKLGRLKCCLDTSRDSRFRGGILEGLLLDQLEQQPSRNTE